MPFLTTYSFDGESIMDWTDPGPHPSPSPQASPYPHSSPFHSNTHSFPGTNVSNQWLAVGRAFSTTRNDTESLVVLSSSSFLNADWILVIIQNQFNGHPNAFFGGKILTSYAYGGAIRGQGGSRGGLPAVPPQFQDRLLLTVNLPFHLNTPPGIAAVNGHFVYYTYIFFQNGNAVATVLGVAHPWAFEPGLLGAGQDQINSQLDAAVQGTDKTMQELLNTLLSQTRARLGKAIVDGYLLPGIVTEPGTSPVTGDASTDITLALILE